MDYQDWNTVVFKKKTTKPKQALANAAITGQVETVKKCNRNPPEIG
jgi:hypothetical protein